ncbi:uncharacterized protein LOC124371868 [Homalodisca vitripennis]|uniref:uncharacterized protein LOC124371868 n=1 Tax=Homalodisca vitripennis TaxID=197043 RepID=UPI001EEC47B3|nr:uncharacterized protein LOC124371868 [Homalodisca vitripennis]
MERRRKALGLRNLDCNKKEKTKESKSSVDNREKSVKEVRELPSHQAGSVTPQRKDATRFSTESPNSPALQSLLPRTLGSPEVEVSWDWGCSQVPREMLPKRRATQPKPVAVILNVPAPIFPRVPLMRKMSEEENQERLAFYKNVLAKSLRRTSDENSDDSKNNNLEKEAIPDYTPMIETPKRLSRSQMSSCKKEEMNALFDDSANEFMLECSQAVEEQLRNGVDVGPIVKVTIPSLKHVHSPDMESDHNHKKVCHGKTKLNLFPEQTNNGISNGRGSLYENRHLNLKSPKSRQSNTVKNCEKLSSKSISGCDSDLENSDLLSMMPTQVNPKVTQRETSVNSNLPSVNYVENKTVAQTKSNINCSIQSTLPQVRQNCNLVSSGTSRLNTPVPFSDNSVSSGRNDVSVTNNPSGKLIQSASYDSVAKFRKVQNCNPITNNVNKNITKPQSGSNIAINKTNVRTNSVSNISANQTRDIILDQKNSVIDKQGSRSNTADFTSLLDDGLDMELCSLDYESICCSDESRGPPVQPPSKHPPQLPAKPPPKPPANSTSKLCSQKEIEAKRIAALNRLMMRKKR